MSTNQAGNDWKWARVETTEEPFLELQPGQYLAVEARIMYM